MGWADKDSQVSTSKLIERESRDVQLGLAFFGGRIRAPR